MRAGFKSGATEYTANHQTMSTADGSLKLDSSVRMLFHYPFAKLHARAE